MQYLKGGVASILRQIEFPYNAKKSKVKIKTTNAQHICIYLNIQTLFGAAWHQILISLSAAWQVTK